QGRRVRLHRALLQFETQALQDRLYESHGVREASWISLSGCHPNRVQATKCCVAAKSTRCATSGLHAVKQTKSYSITSSTRARSVGSMLMPSALAVLRLMMNPNFVGCSTGRSAGLAPLRILSM